MQSDFQKRIDPEGKLLGLSFHKYEQLCSQVSDCAGSLSGCRDSEVQNEAKFLVAAMSNLVAARTARKLTPALRARYTSAISRGDAVLDRRWR
jgi:hypothetical protein